MREMALRGLDTLCKAYSDLSASQRRLARVFDVLSFVGGAVSIAALFLGFLSLLRLLRIK